MKYQNPSFNFFLNRRKHASTQARTHRQAETNLKIGGITKAHGTMIVGRAKFATRLALKSKIENLCQE